MISNAIQAGGIGFITGALGAAAFLFLIYAIQNAKPHSHEWGEYEPVPAWIITPYRNDTDRVALERRFKRECQVDGCDATDTTYKQAEQDCYADGIEAGIHDALEIRKQCPACETAIPDSDIEIDSDGFNGSYIYRCPECNNLTPDTLWNRVPYEALSE